MPQKADVDEDGSNWGPLDLEWLAAQRRRQQQLPADNAAAAAVTVAPPAPPSGSSDAGAPPPPPLSVEQAGSPPPLRSASTRVNASRGCIRARVEIMGSQKCGIGGKSQLVLWMINPMISP
eukprot:COSAG01_NODE_1008_length_12157_cov_17.425029_13_plen_120_part_01